MGRTIAFVLVVLALTGPATSQAGAPLTPSICEVITNPKRFHRKTIRIDAQIFSDGIEHTVLGSDKCPGIGISLSTTQKVEDSAGSRAIDNAIFQGHFGSSGKLITATITGKFLWHPKKLYPRVLIIKQVQDVTVMLDPKRLL
jgi:hypothetical protein